MLFLREFFQRRRQFALSIFNNFLAITLLLTVSVFSDVLLRGMENQLQKMSLQVSCLQYLNTEEAEMVNENFIERYEIREYSEFFLTDEENYQIACCRDLSGLFDLEFHFGRFFNDLQLANNENAAVLGYGAWQDLDCPVPGESFSLNGAEFVVQGVIEEGYENVWFNADEMIFLPLDYLDEAQESRLFFLSEQVYFDDYLNEVLGKDNYLLIQQKMLKNSFMQISRQGRNILLAISAFSLVISLLGMVNHTLSSLKGRCREIGIKKALGADERDIVVQFLLEALLIMLVSSLGAVMAEELIMKTAGLLTSGEFAADRHYGVLLWVIPAGCLCCLYPAYKAGKISVSEAIRN